MGRIKTTSAWLLAVVMLGAGACVAPDDGTGVSKSESALVSAGGAVWGIPEGSPDALGVLKVANDLSEKDLVRQAKVGPLASLFLTVFKAGRDLRLGTRDDRKIETLHQLDAIPFVDRETFLALLAFARAHGGESCGNGTIDPGETCDTGVVSGPGACPTTCDDADICTQDTLVGAGTCGAHCANAPITAPLSGDGCCPSGANANNDGDCATTCGNGVIEPGEACDDGNGQSGDGCSSTCQTEIVPPTAFRVTRMSLSDPHIYAASVGCSDLTGFFNSSLTTDLTTDGDFDGFYDLNLILLFSPLAQAAPQSGLTLLSSAACDVAGGGCRGGVESGAAIERNQAQGVCADGGGHNPAYGPVNTPTDHCFATDVTTLHLPLFGVDVTLHDAAVAAVYGGDPATGLTTGLIRGFVTEADADAIILPPTLPLIGGATLSAALSSDQNCSSHNDLDAFLGQPGWMFYLDFTATKTAYHP